MQWSDKHRKLPQAALIGLEGKGLKVCNYLLSKLYSIIVVLCNIALVFQLRAVVT